MNIFKEYWTLVTALFRKMPDTLEYVEMSHVLWPGYGAMMWCGMIIIRPGYTVRDTTWTHEGIHLQQAKFFKSWWRFYGRYLWQWICNLLVTFSTNAAYFLIDVEKQAYGNEWNEYYIATKEKLKKYKTPLFKRRREWLDNKNSWRIHCRDIEG